MSRLTPGKKYHVSTTADCSAPSFEGEYVGVMELAGDLSAHEFVVQGSLSGMVEGTKEWYPIILPDEIVKVEVLA